MTPSRRRFLGLVAATGAGSALSPWSAGAAAGATAPVVAPSSLRTPRDDEAVLVLAGDLFLTEPFPSRLETGTRNLYQLLGEADAAFANLENGLSTAGSPELGGFDYGAALRGSPALARELTRIGITGVSLANNHTGNYGPEALLETLVALDSEGIAHAGAGENVEAAFQPLIIDAGPLSVALVSVYSFYSGYEADDIAGAERPGLATCRAREVLLDVGSGYRQEGREQSPYLLASRSPGTLAVMAAERDDTDRLQRAVRRASDSADITIVSVHFHWGRHTRRDVPHQQRAFASAAVQAGADLVVGHGPHILRGLELIEGRPVAYSLSNFVLRPDEEAEVDLRNPEDPGRRSVLARITVSTTGVRAVELVPFVIDARGQPHAAGEIAGSRILTEMEAMTGALGAQLEIGDQIASLAVPAHG